MRLASSVTTNENIRQNADSVKRGADLSESPKVALLTAGRDKPYALGMAAALLKANVAFDMIGGRSMDSPILHGNSSLRFLEFRDDSLNAPLTQKVLRILQYYARLLRYAWSASPRIFHILWNNKFEWIDRTVLMVVYRLCGRRIILTAHNVNVAKRDGGDSFLNRMTLATQYYLSDHVFVHTERMRLELLEDFGVPASKCSVIPFGINATVPDTDLDRAMARRQLGLAPSDNVLLFFGNIAPYKGLEYLVQALGRLSSDGNQYRLLIAGGVKGASAYWEQIRESIAALGVEDIVTARVQYIPDEETEIYFKAADLLALPYRHIFQSGVIFLAYNFGLPVVASDVGSLKEDIVEGKTGFVCRAEDPESLAEAIRKYFGSDLFRDLQSRRAEIRNFAFEKYSWSRVAEITTNVYCDLLTHKGIR